MLFSLDMCHNSAKKGVSPLWFIRGIFMRNQAGIVYFNEI